MFFSALICLLSSICETATSQPKLVKLWQTDSVLKVPESVLFDPAGRVLYESNIGGTDPWAKDGNGSIGKVGLNGKIINVDWVTGLDAPKGMGIFKNNLYAADIDQVRVIDISKAAIVQSIPVEGATGLNDITVDRNGVVYVSDSRMKKVHKIENGKATVLLENLQSPNGLFIKGDVLYVLDNGGMYRVEKNKSLTKIADGMDGGTDGIENVTGNDFLVSCWAGSIWYVHADGTKDHLLDTRDQKMNSADIGYDVMSKIVYVPTFWRNSIIAYELK
ncbi:MAG: ATP/GTP-binding protein [Bacteroidetes bacterium]|nr:MAG: ATP/GTP-binding protein [Bacteroidota bacterium]